MQRAQSAYRLFVRCISCVALVGWFSTGIVLGDTIRLFDGSILNGRIKSLDSGTFLLVDSSANEIKVPIRNCMEWSIGKASQVQSSVADSEWSIRIANGGLVHGSIEAMDASQLVVRTENRFLSRLDIPLGRILSISRVATNGSPRINETHHDIVLTQVNPTRTVEVSGRIVRLEKDRLLFEFKGKERSIRLAKIVSILPANDAKPHREPFFLGQFSDSLSIPLLAETVHDDQFVFKTLWGKRFEIPKDGFAVFSARNGRIEFLSDLKPIEVVEISFFDRTIHWRSDRALDGRPLVLDSVSYSKGLATHSHCELIYELANDYSRLMVTVGIDDRKRTLGDAEIAVYADEKEIHRTARLNEANSPIELDLPLNDAKRLRLVSRFGEGQDVGDEVIWANARLLRK